MPCFTQALNKYLLHKCIICSPTFRPLPPSLCGYFSAYLKLWPALPHQVSGVLALPFGAGPQTSYSGVFSFFYVHQTQSVISPLGPDTCYWKFPVLHSTHPASFSWLTLCHRLELTDLLLLPSEGLSQVTHPCSKLCWGVALHKKGKQLLYLPLEPLIICTYKISQNLNLQHCTHIYQAYSRYIFGLTKP